jgi:phospholipase C
MGHTSNPRDGVTRRQALRDLGGAGLGLTAAGAGIEALLAQAAAAAPRPGATLADVKHVVILMQENRSFDHYFGKLSGVHGFSDRANRAAFFQKGIDGRTLHPFHLDSDCLPDLTHEWGPQHLSWNRGRMNQFLAQHQKNDIPSVYGSPVGTAPETLGYYDRSDLPFYYALADAFTVCDMYFCSLIGPTDPNRLMSMSATIDPDGKAGGPIVQTNTSPPERTGLFSWSTMPEALSRRGISWKVYTGTPLGFFDNVMTYFKQYAKGTQLYNQGVAPTMDDFQADLNAGKLPQVSWLVLSVEESEHPGFSNPSVGEAGALGVVEAIVNSSAWKNTALFITYDENGGFFDHVPPPTPPRGTKGEFLTVSTLPEKAEGIRGPIGLGFRVPMIVVSPFTRGGLVCSDVFDHTSTLRFLETRFGVKVPNLSAWRRRVTGDLTSAFNFAAKPNSSRPRLPNVVGAKCSTTAPPTVPVQPMPKQERGRRGRPSGIVRGRPRR